MKQGSKVKVHYTGTLDDGTVFDSSEGRGPLEFTMGKGEVIPGFENGVKEMKLNEEKTVKIKPSDAYGEKNEQLVKEIPRDKMPKEQEPKEGMQLMLTAPTGQKIAGLISEVKKDFIKIDFNHPLAGKQLTFKIKLVEIN